MKRRDVVLGSAGLAAAIPSLKLAHAAAKAPNLNCPPDTAFVTCAVQSTLPVDAMTQDAVTPEQIALYIPVTGALDQGTTASVRYRLAGTSTWQSAAPLWRIQPNFTSSAAPSGVVDAFAGTIFDLEVGSSYQVEVAVTSPVGAQQVLSGTYMTRQLPRARGAVTTAVTGESELKSALGSANPGDVIQFSGLINLSSNIQLNSSGTANDPIYLVGDNRDTAILQHNGRSLQYLDAHWIVCEDFTIRGSGTNSGTSSSSSGVQFFDGNTATNNTFRRMKFEDIDTGIESFRAVHGTLIYDCTFEGNNNWVRSEVESNSTWNDDGIRLGGIGNCVWNCSMTGFGDSVSFRFQNNSFSVIGCYFWRMHIMNSGDDAIEAEYCQRNCGFYDSYTANSMTMLSVDGVYGGPYYHFRNVHLNCGRTIIKNGARATGVLIWANTIVKTQGIAGNDDGDRGWYWSQSAQMNGWEYRNNLYMWLGNNGDILRFDEGTGGWQPWTCTHNGWGRNGQDFRYAGPGLDDGSLAVVNADQSPIHDNDVELGTQADVFNSPVTFGPDYTTPIGPNEDLTLKPGSDAIGKAAVIPNISEHGDLGAIGFGQVAPQYGNRV